MSVSDGQKATAAVFNAAFADIDFRTLAAGTSFTIANNTTANVTGLLMDKTAYRSRVIDWQIYRKSTGGSGQIRVQRGSFMVYHDDTSWTLVYGTMTSDDAGVDFSIDTTSGQISYTSDNDPGTYSALTSKLTYQIAQTMRL